MVRPGINLVRLWAVFVAATFFHHIFLWVNIYSLKYGFQELTKQRELNSAAEFILASLVLYQRETKFLVRGDSGRYLNRNPASAAKKAFRQLCGVKKIRGQCAMFISMRETTQNSSDRVFTYKLNRRKLPEPVVVGGIKRVYETRRRCLRKP